MCLLPFKGRDHSGTYELNFLFKEDKVYIMDNHLAAIWCWTSELDQYFQFFSDEFILKIANEIKKAWKNITVMTIALSPEMC